jgi:uncharacterized membrane protein YfcA
MELIELFGFACALVIGLSLGLIGGGGSVMSVPVLAYLFAIDEKAATAYSLFIVGTSALLGGLKQHFKGYVDWRTAMVFGIPSLIGVAIVRNFVVPGLPEIIFTVNEFEFTRRMLIFGLFAVLMFPAACYMLKEKRVKKLRVKKEIPYNYPLIFIGGMLVGMLTGLLGAGGGFLIIPAVIVMAKLKMKTAVGTSLIIIAVKSLIGFFIGDALTMNIDWNFLAIFTAMAFMGIFIGSYLSNFINGKRLKKGFGYFIFVMAFFIFYMEFFVYL